MGKSKMKFYEGLGTPEEKKQPKTSSNDLGELLKIFEQALDVNLEDFVGHYDEVERIIKTVDQVLTPEEINSFLQQTIPYEQHYYYKERTGDMVSKLIQNSYDAGHNNFKLNTKALKEVDAIALGLIGQKENPINILVQGNLGNICGNNISDTIMKVEGSVGVYFGQDAEDSILEVHGNADENLGYSSKNTSFLVTGYVVEKFGIGTINSTFDFHGECKINLSTNPHVPREYHGITNCEFTVYRKKYYNKVLKVVPKGNNTIMLKDKKGKIIKEKKK